MTFMSDEHGAMPSDQEKLSRRRLLAMGLGTAVGGAVLVAGPGVAQAAGAVLLERSAATGPGRARSGVVSDWLDQLAASPLPRDALGLADRVWAITWVSAQTALDLGNDRRSAFETAAVAVAAHDALVALVPDQAGRLDAALAASLAAIDDGDAKQAGIRAGQEGAARTLRDRENDGMDPESINAPVTLPPPGPGVFQLPPDATETLAAGLARARPFLLDRADRFRPGPPAPIGSDIYRRDWDETRRMGAAVGSERTTEQDETAFLAPGMQYIPALQAIVGATGRSLRWKVRLLEAYSVATLDAFIACVEAKMAYMWWRPITAIRLADTDGDPWTAAYPDWTPYLATPAFPEYPGAHSTIAGAAEKVLTTFTGPGTPVPFTAQILKEGGVVVATRQYPRGTPWSSFTQDNIGSRVYAGVHWRYSDDVAAEQGRQVAGHDLRRLGLRPR